MFVCVSESVCVRVIMVRVRYVHIHRYTHNYQVPFAIIHKDISAFSLEPLPAKLQDN